MSETRAKKSGIGAEIEKKREDSYDKAHEAGTTEAIKIWINAIVGCDHVPISSAEHRELYRSLKDGVMICKLINKLLVSEGKKAHPFQKKVASSFVAYSNMSSFNKGLEDYGIKQEFHFQSTDLWEGSKSQFLNVVNTLHRLGMKANEKNYETTYTGKTEAYLSNE